MSEPASEKKAIAPGDDVFLTSDGPEMKVESIKGDDCECVWIDAKHVVHRSVFKRHTLSKVDRGYG